MFKSLAPPPLLKVGNIPVWSSGPLTFSPFTLLASIDTSLHAVLKSAGMEVDILNLMNAINGKTTLTARSRNSLQKRAPVTARLLLPVIDHYISTGEFETESAWRSVHSSLEAHQPSHELESAIDYLARCDEFTEFLRNSRESMDKLQRDKLIIDFLGFEHHSELGYPGRMKVMELVLTETTLTALAKFDLALNQLSESDRRLTPISYFTSLLNPANSPIKQWWINLKDQLNLRSFRELSDLLQDKQESFEAANPQGLNINSNFDYTQIRKWSSGVQHMKWTTAETLEILLGKEAKACASRELNALARVFAFLEKFIALSAGLELKQHAHEIRSVLLKRYQFRWNSEMENLI